MQHDLVDAGINVEDWPRHPLRCPWWPEAMTDHLNSRTPAAADRGTAVRALAAPQLISHIMFPLQFLKHSLRLECDAIELNRCSWCDMLSPLRALASAVHSVSCGHPSPSAPCDCPTSAASAASCVLIAGWCPRTLTPGTLRHHGRALHMALQWLRTRHCRPS